MPGGTGAYAGDLGAVLAWGPGLVLTMTPEAELTARGAGRLGDDLRAAGIGWRRLPIADFGAPDAVTAALWPAASVEALGVLRAGGRVLAHCMGGCGRSGMAVLRLMVELGEPPQAALARLRAVRPCAVETEDQRIWAAAGAPV